MALSKSQLDRLGERLKESAPSEPDLKQLDEYRRSFSDAAEHVVLMIRASTGLEPAARPAKSTTSLIEKLKRESARLTQVQDIAGCRIVVEGIDEQEKVLGRLREMFPGTAIVDRRKRPSFGYRAIHAIPRIEGMLVEIQLRTSLQHLWAELSEKLADRYGFELKYGGGPDKVRKGLQQLSQVIATYEEAEKETFLLEGVDARPILAKARRTIENAIGDLLRLLEARKPT
jgi:putative GTP pyrophosphokinase